MSDSPSSWKRLLCLLLILGICGCNRTPKPDDPSANSAETGGTEAAPAGAPGSRIIPVRRDVKDLEGNWVMVTTLQGRDHYLWVAQLKKNDQGQFQGDVLDISKNEKSPFHPFLSGMEPVLDGVEIDGTSVKLKAKSKVGTFDFEGQFDGVAVRGTLAASPQEILIGRLLPADASKLSDYVTDALPPAADLFMNAIKSMQNQPDAKVILKLARENRTSPLSLEAVYGMLTLHSRAGFDDATVLAIIAQYIDCAKVWGPRMQIQAEIASAQQMVTSARLPSEALKHLSEAEKLLGENAAAMKSRIQMFREQAEIQVSLAKSHSKSEEDRAAAHSELQSALEKQPYNAEILLALAEYAAATEQEDVAIEYYSSIVALPLLEQFVLARRAGKPPGDPTPSEVLTTLWTKKHGDKESLDPHLNKIHQDRLGSLRNELRKAGAPVPPLDAGDHTVLVEFFTGGQMPPAVATEVAMDAIRETYPTSQVVALRYHQHVPGPDGLVNQDSEDRFAYYEQGRTPIVALDGALLDPDQVPYGGFVQTSGTAYTIFRAVVDPRVKQSTPIRIELSAAIENGDLAIQAAVTGATEEQLPSLRLRLALAEESVEAPMPNGIRSHAMVVREMPGGARGIAPKKGELKFSFSMPASDLQQHLDDYLTRYEAGNKIEIPAEAKPGIRNPLYLVGWVQNDKLAQDRPEIGRAILQTAIIPVTGSGSFSESKTEPNPKPVAASTEKAAVTPPPPALPE